MIHLHIIKQSDAKAAGLHRYCTGKPCQYNQIGERLTSNGMCRCFICTAVSVFKSKRHTKENREYYNEKQKERQRAIRKAERLAPSTPTFISKDQIK